MAQRQYQQPRQQVIMQQQPVQQHVVHGGGYGGQMVGGGMMMGGGMHPSMGVGGAIRGIPTMGDMNGARRRCRRPSASPGAEARPRGPRQATASRTS
jgi:hypothetical protein